MPENLAVVVLAAGKGKRMNNPDLPKVLAEINEKPILWYVLNQIQKLSPSHIILVVGHQKLKVIEYADSLCYNNISYAHQDEQLGTGHAVNQTKPLLENFDGDVLILAGDVPNISSETLNKFISLHCDANSDVSVLSAVAKDSTGYGRIIRNEGGGFLRITEHKDATETEREIKEINSGIFVVNSKILFNALADVKNNNIQAEYYLTDIISILRNENKNVMAFNCADFEEIQGVNNLIELENARIYLNKKLNQLI
jgi:bifunctional UDP-N-acetylglucosamine pyrophosphorylase/glucosamine-1-phosphate N-acetyltransferase